MYINLGNWKQMFMHMLIQHAYAYACTCIDMDASPRPSFHFWGAKCGKEPGLPRSQGCMEASNTSKGAQG